MPVKVTTDITTRSRLSFFSLGQGQILNFKCCPQISPALSHPAPVSGKMGSSYTRITWESSEKCEFLGTAPEILD